ncbi:diuretic hormone receptor-like isoform X2 [Scylla paramamosain]|uniref:diuretic hormone receptor-like isoform X2 n=1 Tax=Scylla paramamosain TaxID=85552 RepID=UPI0030829173
MILELPTLENEGNATNAVLPQQEEMWHSFMNQSTLLPNTTMDKHKLFMCFDQFVRSRASLEHDPKACSVKFDGVSCWPETPPGRVRIIPCFETFNGVRYDPSENNATLLCFPNGTWSSKSSYTHCLKLVLGPSLDHVTTTHTTKTIFYFGHSLSLAAVTLALCIFLSFKDLRCLRNTIHANLLATYLLHNFFWIVFASVQTLLPVNVVCSFVVPITYFNLTSFMWMSVEGFYLYMLVVKIFSVDNIKLRVYTIIGWGVPVPIIIVWVAVKSTLVGTLLDETGIEGHVLDGFPNACPLIPLNTIDWIYQVPMLVFLSLNVLFLMRIMWVLITKLRSANTVETQRYRKATKALVVLIPLLGLTYILFIALPREMESIRALLLSTQGFWVALFYCFLNNEVQNSVRHHLERWKASRGLVDQRSSSVRHRRELSPLPGTRYLRKEQLYAFHLQGPSMPSKTPCREEQRPGTNFCKT